VVEGEVAAATLACLRRTVPAAVPGVAFLSGGRARYDDRHHFKRPDWTYQDDLVDLRHS
jgi:fructose-bisphosphate aldolase class 1